ncbi:MAG: four helix bundle protein [Actinomycetota bacterium]|nr:four helix bundle protein [Actinomycetota bacterium]
MHDHQQLRAWKASRRFVSMIYGLTRQFPDDERFGLTTQLRRAAVSIPSNIAEGAGRSGSGRSFSQFLRIASGSASEVETQLQIAQDLELATSKELLEALDQIQDIRRMLWGLEQHHSAKQ